MSLATLTSKGQVTIPKDIRESLHLHSGDKIEIIITGNQEAIIKPISVKVDDLFCVLHDPSRQPLSVEDMNSAIKTRMKKKQS